jgi:hypothetical protein
VTLLLLAGRLKKEEKMNRGRRWVAIDRREGHAGQPFEVHNAAELTPEDVGFLAEAINGTIEQWGDPEGDLDRLRKKLRGEDGTT